MKKTDVLLSTQSTANIGLLTNEINIYPNPVLDNLLNVEGIEDNVHYIIINELGQIVKTFSLSENNNRKIPINDLENGIYFVIDQNNKAVLRQKVVVAK